MRLTDASVAIRPRTAWEALDLGVLLARRHAGLLIASWALLSLPVFALLCLLLWDHPGWALFAFWWLKPAFERLPLYILSRSLFAEPPTLGQAMRALPGVLRPQLLASLTWRRLSLTRSFDLPVLQLEGLSGQARAQRLVVLGQRETRFATWLTVVGVHVEMALWLGLGSLFYMLLPAQLELDWNWQRLLEAAEGDWLWLEHLSNLVYVLPLMLWEPVYVACGFTLYLNRRTALEAWDIELVFRRLRQRLTGSAYALLLGLGLSLTLLPMAPPALAESSEVIAPEAPRLLKQPLTSEASRQSIEALLDAPPFEHRETLTRWRLGDDQEQASESDPETAKNWLERLLQLRDGWQHLGTLALIFEALLWAAVLALIGLLLWRYRQWLHLFASRLRPPSPVRRDAPTQLFGLDVAPERLPDDIAAEAERLWREQPRAALGLLYRALLSRLLHQHHLPLTSAHTEGEVLEQVAQFKRDDLNAFSQILTRHWQAAAYGNRLPPQNACADLCAGWRQLFPAGAAR
ncbi:protein of unknown function [Pseudomonas cuatrocienegasensis]|uniref:Protein-glutamine gamma-glutamyltransferase-like C-terminal domain-containing protein n=2 Tax=Pseudomonas TaxID=286 RepID=A0ABY1BCW4_9PSED|nr:DUF4129 domain-containing protein [Pseudomonas cuatrocienegasensis]SEQ56494.1 protein of unknown function [Pseudomonas cuatrocienegasensis]